MRLVTEEPELRGRKKTKLRLGWEDILLAATLLILIVGYVRGQLLIKEVLGYLGFTASGGIWGAWSAKASRR